MAEYTEDYSDDYFKGTETALVVGGSVTPTGDMLLEHPDWLYVPDYLNWRSLWDATIVYDEFDVVLHPSGDETHAFVSKQNHNVGNVPNTAYQWWTRLVQERWQ